VADDDGYREIYALTEAIRRSGRRAYWHIVVPSWVTDGLRGHDKMSYVYLDCTRDVTTNDLVGFPAFELAQYFCRRGGRFIVDAVITGCSRYGVYLQQLLSDRATKTPMPMFIRERANPIAWNTVVEQVAQAVNYTYGHLAVESEGHRKSTLGFVRQHLTPAMQKVFLERSVLWPNGYNLDELDATMSGTIRHSGVTALCAGTFDEPKVYRDVLKMYRKLFASANIQSTIVTTSAMYKVHRAYPSKDRAFLRSIDVSLFHDAYRREVAKNHFFISAVSGFDCASVLEDELLSLLLGQVGVFPRGPLTSTRLDGYPFMYDNEDEALSLAEWVALNWEKALRMVEPFVSGLRNELSVDNAANVFWSEICHRIDSCYKIHQMKNTKKDAFRTVYDVATKLGEQFDLDVFLDVLEEHLTWLKPWGKGALKEMGRVSPGLPTLYDIREMLDNLGWVDACDGMNIVLNREREPAEGVLDGGN
jgi:hypothetical protein